MYGATIGEVVQSLLRNLVGSEDRHSRSLREPVALPSGGVGGTEEQGKHIDPAGPKLAPQGFSKDLGVRL